MTTRTTTRVAVAIVALTAGTGVGAAYWGDMALAMQAATACATALLGVIAGMTLGATREMALAKHAKVDEDRLYRDIEGLRNERKLDPNQMEFGTKAMRARNICEIHDRWGWKGAEDFITHYPDRGAEGDAAGEVFEEYANRKGLDEKWLENE